VSSSSGNCRLRPCTLKSGLARDVTATLSRSARSNPPRHIGNACRWLRCASKPLSVSKAIPHPLHVDLKFFRKKGAIGLGSTFFLGLGRPPGCRSDGTGHLSTKITCNVENLSTLCGAPKRLIMVESGILFFRIFPCVPNFLFLTTDVEFILSG
jgi:hypothetical protein